MTLIFVDSFDHYVTKDQMMRKWNSTHTAGTVTTEAGGRTARRLNLPGSIWVRKVLPVSKTTIIMGGAWRTSSLVLGTFFYFEDINNLDHIHGRINPDGSITIRNGHNAVLFSTAAGVISGIDTWHYIECKCTVDNVAGSVFLHVNGVDVGSATGVDTQGSAETKIGKVQLYAGSGIDKWDDFYILDDSGVVNNDFLGDVTIEAIVSDGVGNSADWTPSAGANWQNVDEIPPDDDVAYNETAVLNEIDTFSYADLVTLTGSISGIQLVSCTRKPEAGSKAIKHIARPGVVDREGIGTHQLGEDYMFFWDIWENNPDTALPWTIADINISEFGIKMEA